MLTLTALPASANSAARRWFAEHLPELKRHCRHYIARLPRREREEASAEVLACIFKYALKAEQRGVLGQLTPFTMVSFMARAYCDGRKLTGTSSRDVLSYSFQRRHRLRVVSLDEADPECVDGRRRGQRLAEALPDPKADRPDENTRRNLDYPLILRRERANRKLRVVFKFLVATLGQGRGKDLARELRVSPPRVCQLKDKLGRMLALHGYGPRRPVRICVPSKRPAAAGNRRVTAIPLNVGTTPGHDIESRPLRLLPPISDRDQTRGARQIPRRQPALA